LLPFDSTSSYAVNSRKRVKQKGKDSRTWRLRLKHLQENWEPLMSKLASGYLSWKYEPRPPMPTSDSPTVPPSPWDFSIEVADIYTVQTTAQIHRSAEVESTAEALVLNGYLPTTPESPSFAVSLKTLELFRCIRIRKPSFSIEAFAKVLCDLYGVRLSVYQVVIL
jgi:hypothetical protein